MRHEIIKLSDFSTAPFGRTPEDGPENGEVFRESILLPALTAQDTSEVTVDFDCDGGVVECGSSFLDEAFGGLVTKHGLAPDFVFAKLRIKCTAEDYIVEVEQCIRSTRAS